MQCVEVVCVSAYCSRACEMSFLATDVTFSSVCRTVVFVMAVATFLLGVKGIMMD